MSFERQQLEHWLKKIDVKADRVIDFGGATLPMPTRTRTWDVREYKILDITDRRRANADYKYDLNYPIELVKTGFDVGFCTEVMQFIWNPMTAIKNMYKFLNPGGKLYINFHEVIPQMKGTDYLRYTNKGVMFYLKSAGFRVDDVHKSSSGQFIKATKI